MKKILFIGGIKSGKSLNAEKYILKISTTKPIYLATTEFIDEEMNLRIQKHKEQRKNRFITVEESLKLYETISKLNNDFILIECVSMWINNMLFHKFSLEDITNEIQNLLTLNKHIVFVLNDVSCSVISMNKLVREFVDINGKVAQQLASTCKEVYNTTAGISYKIK